MKRRRGFLAVIAALIFGVGTLGLAPVTHAAEDFDCTKDTAIFHVECGENGEGINSLLVNIVAVVSGVVAALGVAGIIFAAVRYTTAGANAEKAAQAKKMIFNIVIGLVAYGVIAAFLAFIGINAG